MVLCVLAYDVEFHLQNAWAKLLYTYEEGSIRFDKLDLMFAAFVVVALTIEDLRKC